MSTWEVADHHGVVEDGHVGHAALGVAGVEIGAEEGILVGRRAGGGLGADEVAVALEDAGEVARRGEGVDDDADRDAGAAALAGRAVGDVLAAAEAALGEDVVEGGGAIADEMGEDLALGAAGQVRAGGGRRQVELRSFGRVLRHAVKRESCPSPTP